MEMISMLMTVQVVSRDVPRPPPVHLVQPKSEKKKQDLKQNDNCKRKIEYSKKNNLPLSKNNLR